MKTVLFVCTLALFSQLAGAHEKQASDKTRASEVEREFTVPVPQSEIQLERHRFERPRSSEYGLSTSSYAPERFERGSYTGRVSEFDKLSVPAVTLNRLSPLMTGEHFNLSTKFGVTYLQMERTMTRKVAGAFAGDATETMNFIVGRAGIESAYTNFLPWGFEPNLSFQFLPTWISAQKSVFEDNVGAFGILLSGSAGLIWRSKVNSTGLGDFSLGLAYERVTGSVGGSSLRGDGVVGEFRVTL